MLQTLQLPDNATYAGLAPILNRHMDASTLAYVMEVFPAHLTRQHLPRSVPGTPDRLLLYTPEQSIRDAIIHFMNALALREAVAIRAARSKRTVIVAPEKTLGMLFDEMAAVPMTYLPTMPPAHTDFGLFMFRTAETIEHLSQALRADTQRV